MSWNNVAPSFATQLPVFLLNVDPRDKQGTVRKVARVKRSPQGLCGVDLSADLPDFL